MAGTIQTRFSVLLDIKRAVEKRSISLQHVQAETGLAWTTLQRYDKNELTGFTVETLTTLCEYFKCSVGDLLVYVPLVDGPTASPMKPKQRRRKTKA